MVSKGNSAGKLDRGAKLAVLDAVQLEPHQQASAVLLKSALRTIESHARQTGVCWASRQRLAQSVCCSERQMIRAVNALLELGLITRSVSEGETDRLAMVWEKVFQLPTGSRFNLSTPDTMSPRQDVTPDTMSPLPLTPCHPTPDTLSSPYIEKRNRSVSKKRNSVAKPNGSEEVSDYWTKQKLNGEPEEFFDYYESNGWVQGKGKPIKNWKSAANNWSRNQKKSASKNRRATNTGPGVNHSEGVRENDPNIGVF